MIRANETYDSAKHQLLTNIEMNKKLNRQIDLHVSGLHVREAAEGEERSRTIEGHAVVFGKRSVNLTPWSSYREVYEIMEPGCITQDLINRSDVVLTAFHNNEIILGRSVNGKGTLSLQLDGKGMLCRCTLAETATADELLSSIERGDITGMSFAFMADEADSETGVSYERIEARNAAGKEVWLRHVKRVTALYDVTIAGHPAYPQTDIKQREAVDAYLDGRIGEPAGLIAQREADREAREKAEQEQREAKEREEREKEERIQREMQRRLDTMRRLSNDSDETTFL